MNRPSHYSLRQKRHPIIYITLSLALIFAQPAAVFATDTAAPAAETTPAATETQPSATSDSIATTSTATTPAAEQPPAQTTPTTQQEAPALTEVSSHTPAPSPQQGPTQPTGADSSEYTFNPATGMWENGHYAWNPETNQTKPLTAPEYSYNPETGMWDTTEWVYDAPSGTYVENTKSVPKEQAAQALAALGVPADEAEQMLSTATPSPSAGGSGAATATSAAPASQNKVNATKETNGTFDLFYNSNISNSLTSLAQTGNALINGNTLGGSALSGDAMAIANLVNMLQSSWGIGQGNLLTFLSNITGDVFGDLMFDPAALPANTNVNQTTNVDVNASADAAINNDIELDAVSGNAAVTNNTQAGDAASGNAYAMANIVNAINSAIASDTSFMGMINIFGNLNGDILLPENLLNALLASGGTQNTNQTTNLNVDTTNNQSVANNVNASAASGSATVANNTEAGSAITGDAETNVTLLNLTGRQIIGERAMLVFVNVLGNWVGMIMDAPQGSNSAALGGGISQNTSTTTNANLTSTANSAITNNVDVNARSGDAEVSQNTSAGDATTGDAKAAVNIANIIGSQLGFSEWFGVLFINVFGSWNGSFGKDTDAGEAPTSSTTPGRGQGSTTHQQPTVAFVPHSAPVSSSSSYKTWAPASSPVSSTGSRSMVEAPQTTGATLAASTYDLSDVVPTANQTGFSPSSAAEADNRGWNWPLLQIVGLIVGFSLLGAERALHYRDKRRMTMQ